jgi:hypothetical protein
MRISELIYALMISLNKTPLAELTKEELVKLAQEAVRAEQVFRSIWR